MAIYGNTISFGGGGQNDTLPPLLDNFRAAKGKYETVAFEDIPISSTVLLGKYKGKPIKWAVVGIEEVYRGPLVDMTLTALKIYDRNLISKRYFDPVVRLSTKAPEITDSNSYEESYLGKWLNSNDKSAKYYDENGFLSEWTPEEKNIFDTKQKLVVNFDVYLPNIAPKNAKLGFDTQTPCEEQALFWSGMDSSEISSQMSYVYGDYQNIAQMGLMWDEILGAEPIICIKGDTPFVFNGTDYVLESAAETQPIVISADKMQESRAADLAGAVWVYGDHLPKNVNDGTKIELNRDEIVADSGTIEKSVSWDKSKNFYARQFTYNQKKQYQTMIDGAIAFVQRPTMKVGDLPSKSKVGLGRTKYQDKIYDFIWLTTKDKIGNQYLALSPIQTEGSSQFLFALEYAQQSTGSNDYLDYSVSFIRQWLNSDKKGTDWFTPNSVNHELPQDSTYKYYDSFLHLWEQKEKDILLTNSWKYEMAGQHTGGGNRLVAIRTIEDKVFLPSLLYLYIKESEENLDIYKTAQDRIFPYDRKWWTSSASEETNNKEYFMWVVDSSGGQSLEKPDSFCQIVPIVKISPDTLVYADPDENGVYSFCFEKEDQIMGTARKVYEYGNVAPEDKNLIWIQPNGLAKFWNGSEWVAIAGVYAEEEG